MTDRIVQYRPRIVLLLVLACAIASGSVGWLLYSRVPPSDDDLRSMFQLHPAQFRRLKDMMLEEPALSFVGGDMVGEFCLWHGKWTNHKPPYTLHTQSEMMQMVGISAERYQEYLDLLDAVGAYRVSKGLGQNHKGEVALHIYRYGIVSSGVCKNVVYSLHPLSNLVKDTDSHLAGKSKGQAYAEIGDGWYIEKQCN
jgi:hypothetical protein